MHWSSRPGYSNNLEDSLINYGIGFIEEYHKITGIFVNSVTVTTNNNDVNFSNIAMRATLGHTGGIMDFKLKE